MNGINKLKIKDSEYSEDNIDAIELRYQQLTERLFDERRGYNLEEKSDEKLCELVTDRNSYEKQSVKEIFSQKK